MTCVVSVLLYTRHHLMYASSEIVIRWNTELEIQWVGKVVDNQKYAGLRHVEREKVYVI